MKLSVSLPARLLYKEAGTAAKALGLSRNRLVQTALEELLERRRDEIVTGSINRYIEKYGNDLSEEEEVWIAQGQETVRQFLEEYESSTKRGRTAPRRQSKRR
jgi:metal-responsive CopG/Arc/MetJ family transcriptional regulator